MEKIRAKKVANQGKKNSKNEKSKYGTGSTGITILHGDFKIF
jgi:hypothetical protein